MLLAAVLLKRASTVELDWDVRQKSRFDATDSTGRMLGIFLARGTLVRGGDVLVAEDGGNMELCVVRPDRGVRFSTYAVWWIKASIQDYVMRNWSMVRTGSTSSQKSLFFNLRRMKNRIEAFEDGDLKPEDVTKIARDLGVGSALVRFPSFKGIGRAERPEVPDAPDAPAEAGLEGPEPDVETETPRDAAPATPRRPGETPTRSPAPQQPPPAAPPPAQTPVGKTPPGQVAQPPPFVPVPSGEPREIEDLLPEFSEPIGQEALAHHFEEELSFLGQELRPSKLPPQQRALRLWAFFTAYAEANAKDPSGQSAEGRARFEEALAKNGFAALRDANTGKNGLQLALALLARARRRFEEEQQPRVIQLASEHFAALTHGRYRRVFLPAGGSRELRVSGARGEKGPEQLSRGTREQLYLAFRLAVIQDFGETRGALPLIVDDILVNFDLGRTRGALELFARLAERHQVIAFTCHAWLRELFEQKGAWVVDVASGGASGAASGRSTQPEPPGLRLAQR